MDRQIATTKRNYRLSNSSPQSSHPIELRCQLDGGPDCRGRSHSGSATAGLKCLHCEMSDSFVRCQCAKRGGMMKGSFSDISVSGKPFVYLGCMRLTAHWTDSYPVAQFWFIWSDKLGLPKYPPTYITLDPNSFLDGSKPCAKT